MKFSLLMSIYHKESPLYFHRAMQSIWDEQTHKPNEIILVQDGNLTDELYDIIDRWKEKIGDILRVIVLKKNLGLGDALNIGLNACHYELVARMDTDDISDPDRFRKQIAFFEQNTNIDIVGSWISEFDTDESIIVSYRKLPKKHNEIILFAKNRNPLNHPSVMYRKKSVLNAGNYLTMIGFEDYYLWVRMIQNGSTIENIPESLVNMRTGFSQLERRGGIRYMLNEIKFQKKLLDIDFINYNEFMRNVFTRITIRIMPSSIRKIVYKLIRKKD